MRARVAVRRTAAVSALALTTTIALAGQPASAADPRRSALTLTRATATSFNQPTAVTHAGDGRLPAIPQLAGLGTRRKVRTERMVGSAGRRRRIVKTIQPVARQRLRLKTLVSAAGDCVTAVQPFITNFMDRADVSGRCTLAAHATFRPVAEKEIRAGRVIR